jgi:hypothetical protein
MPVLQLTTEEAGELRSILEGYFSELQMGDRTNRKRSISREATKPRADRQETDRRAQTLNSNRPIPASPLLRPANYSDSVPGHKSRPNVVIRSFELSLYFAELNKMRQPIEPSAVLGGSQQWCLRSSGSCPGEGLGFNSP